MWCKERRHRAEPAFKAQHYAGSVTGFSATGRRCPESSRHDREKRPGRRRVRAGGPAGRSPTAWRVTQGFPPAVPSCVRASSLPAGSPLGGPARSEGRGGPHPENRSHAAELRALVAGGLRPGDRSPSPIPLRGSRLRL